MKEVWQSDRARNNRNIMFLLPSYMVPTIFEEVESIRYNEHGKKIRSVRQVYFKGKGWYKDESI